MTKINELFQAKNTFTKYHQHIELFFENEVEDIKKTYSTLYDMRANPWDYEDVDITNFENNLLTNHYEFEVEFRSKFRNSFVVQLYSFLESELRTYCINHYEQNNKEYSVNDIKGNNDIDKIKKYLKNSASKDLATNKLLWEFINDFRKLRNKITHSEGVISKNDNDYNSLLKFSQKNFQLYPLTHNNNNEGKFIIVLDKPNFIDKCIENVFQFIHEVIK